MSAEEARARRAWLAGVQWSRAARRSEASASVAFDAWWMSQHSLPQEVPAEAPSWWHGHWTEPGRRLYDRRGQLAEHPALDTLPLDGGYAPEREDYPQGAFKRTVVASNGDVYTILAWWDRSHGDARIDANACFIVRGDQAYASEAMLEAFPRHFPRQAMQLAGAGIQLREVKSP